jgi:(5-formylfuran-3-yl)methyl phosphate synthase
MRQLTDFTNQTGLLVSVRNADEAVAAIDGGAHIIDVKEPTRGSLGAADRRTLIDIVRAVAGRAYLTAASGELADLIEVETTPLPPGVSLFKIGLARCATMPDWSFRWRSVCESLWPAGDAMSHAVAVAYADWRTALSPEPRAILSEATRAGCPALLVDTSDKTSGGLFEHWPERDLEAFVRSGQDRGLLVVLAGSLVGDSVKRAAGLRPNVIAVRTAACEGGRNGAVNRQRVASLCAAIASVKNSH